MGIFNEQSFDHPFAKGIQGAPGVGFRLTADGNFDMSKKRLTNVGAPSDNSDAATKKYVDDNRGSGGGGASTTSRLTVDSNIDMKDRYRILNLKHPVDADEPATKQYSDSRYLDRDGSRTMIGNLDLNNNKIIKVGAPFASDDAATKKYVDDTHTGAAVKSSKLVVDSNIDMKNSFRIRNLQSPLSGKEPPTKDYVDNTFLERDGSYPMKGNLKMDNNRITGLPAPSGADQPTTLSFSNLKYLSRDGTAAMTANLNMNNKKITDLSSPTANTDAATKKYVDDAAPDLSDYLEKDGSVAMTGNFNMNNKKIINLSTPTSNTDAATKKYVDDNRGGGGSGDFKKDGSVAMTGNLNMGSNRIVSLADPTDPSDSANMSWVKKQIQHFDVLASPVFTVSGGGAYIVVYLQHQSVHGGKFVFTTSSPGQPLVSWKPATGTYVNKIVFNFSRNINVTKVSFVARDSKTPNFDFWVSKTHTGYWTLNIHKTWTYELSGVFLYYATDETSSHLPITTSIFTGKPSATTRDFKKITFNVPTEFTGSVSATTPTTSAQLATKGYVDNAIAGPPHYKNVFEYLFSSASQWTDEISSRTSFLVKKIGDLPPADGNFHSYNYKAINLGINKFSGGYNFKMGVNFYRLAAGDYTICFELLNNDYTLWHKTQVSLDHQSSTGITFLKESIKKETYSYFTNSQQYMYYHRIVVSFNKGASGSAFLHLLVNMPQVGNDMTSYPAQFTGFYVIVYGVRGEVGDVDPDKSFDYHTAFDVRPSEVSYNVGINANNHSITNLAIDQNASSAATVGMINELKYFLPYHFYLAIFDEIFFFTLADNYVFTIAPDNNGVNTYKINKLKSIKGTSAVAFPNRELSSLKKYGLDVVNYNLEFPLKDNTTLFSLVVNFYFWNNRDFVLTRWDTARNTKIFEISYSSNQNRVIAYMGRLNRSFTPGLTNGHKFSFYIRHTASNLLVAHAGNGFLSLQGLGSITAQKQKVTFLTKGGVVNKIMFSYKDIASHYNKIFIQEILI